VTSQRLFRILPSIILGLIFLTLVGCIAVPSPSVEPRYSSGSQIVRKLIFPPLQIVVPRLGIEVQRCVLSNGMVLYLASDPAAPTLNLFAAFRGGTLYSDSFKTGVPEATVAQLRSGGTTNHSHTRMADALDDLGISVETAALSDTLSLGLAVLEKHADRALDLFADMIRHPTFETPPLQTYKAQLLESLRRLPETPSQLLSRELAHILFTDKHPAGRILTPSDVHAIQAEDLHAYSQRFIRPDNMWLAVVGNRPVADLAESIRIRFADWRGTTSLDLPSPPSIDLRFRPEVYLLPRRVSQSSVILGHFGVTGSNPDRYAIDIMNLILGGNGFGSRLVQRLRTKEGLAYSISSAFPTSAPGMSLFRTAFQTKNENVPRALQMVLEEMRRMQREPVSAEELAGAKDTLINTFASRFTSRFRTVMQMLSLELEGLPSNHLETLLDRYRATTVDDVQRSARRYLHPEAATILIAGNPAAFESSIDAFGPTRFLEPSPGK
jgi:zinc protease